MGRIEEEKTAICTLSKFMFNKYAVEKWKFFTYLIDLELH